MMTTDTLELRGLEVECVIGDLPLERTRPQTLLLDIALECDFSKVALSDDLLDTVDYAALATRVRQTLVAGKYRMLEAAAERVARECLADQRVRRVSVAVEKRGGVVGLHAAVARVHRERGALG